MKGSDFVLVAAVALVAFSALAVADAAFDSSMTIAQAVPQTSQALSTIFNVPIPTSHGPLQTGHW